MPNNNSDFPLRNQAGPQLVERKQNAVETWPDAPPAILPVVEILTHRWLCDTTLTELRKQRNAMPQARIEACVRYGVKRQIKALREEVARLRAEVMGRKAA